MGKTLDEILEGLPPARREKIEQRSQELIREYRAHHLAASISHHEATIAELSNDKTFAQAYLSAAFEELENLETRPVFLLALRDVAEAYGGLAAVAQKAKVSLEEIDRTLSPNGDPDLKTLLAILHAVGMRLSVVQLPRDE